MKTRILLSFSLFLCTVSAIAQQPIANLTIFSEDGDKFFLYLNGEQQNTVAQTNLRIEDLPQLYYSAKIIFEDKAIPEILKNHLGLADANGVLQDVTYKIKRDKNKGKMSLKYYSMVPVLQNYTPPSNVYVHQYGVPVQVISATPTQTTGTTVTQTTTTTTGVGHPNSTGVNVNTGGINMNINITEPVIGGTSQTTTTTTTSSSTNMNTNTSSNTSVNNACMEMLPIDFTAALATIKKQGFDETKLSTAKQIAGSNCISTTQIVSICKEFGFEETKLDFAKFAYDHCSEKKNYFKVNNVFNFSSSTDELNAYIQNK